MWNEPSDADLQKLPRLYSTDGTPWQDVVIHEHFFLGGCDWYLAEYDSSDRVFYGYAILNNDLDNAEWGYISFDELRAVKAQGVYEVDRDLHWTPQAAGEIDRIVKAYKQQGLA